MLSTPEINAALSRGTRSQSTLSNLEKNCNQIFVKGPTITKEFFDKIQHEVVPHKTDLFGYQMNTRRLILLTGLILLFTFSTMGTITMWFTDSYQQQINSMLVLSEESPAYNLWKNPPPQPYVNIHLFNYTNVEEFESGSAKKLHVEEVGPYVYFEKLERMNVRFNKVDGTVSYQEKRTYTFNEELSSGTKDDLVTVPNIPLLAGAYLAKHQFNFLVRMSYSGLLTTLSEQPFKTLRADDLINGYEDHLYDLSKSYLKFQDKRTFDHFGLLVWRAGLQPDVFTMNTGLHNISKLGQIEKFNGETNIDMWSSDSCNNIQASDGTLYPPSLVKAKKDLTFFMPQMCRKLKLKFLNETTILDKVPVYRYVLPMDVFDSPEDKQCYCTEDGICPPRGLFNATECSMGAPLFYSWPHFYNADPALRDAISGLKENPVMDNAFVDVHSKVGVILKGNVKIQANVLLEKSFGIAQMKPYPESLMLPVVWVESGLEEKDLTPEVIDLIYQATFTVRNLELGLKYGCLLSTMVTLTCILLVLKKHRADRRRADSFRRPLDIEQ